MTFKEERVNAYFEEMEKVMGEWRKEKDAREAKKQQIIEKFDYESKELKAWYEEDAKAKEFPYAQGAVKAYLAWREGKRFGKPVLKDSLWDNEIADFCKTLRFAGVQLFVIADESTALMRNIHGFIAERCHMGGIWSFENTHELFGETIVEKTLGMIFYL